MAIYKLGTIGIFRGGISTLDKTKYGSGVFFINYMDVFSNFSIKNTANLVLYDASVKDLEKYIVNYGEALFTASSETPEEIAMSTVYLSHKVAIFNGFTKKFSFNHQILLPEYAAYLFRGSDFRKKASQLATGYTRHNISQKDLNDIEVEIPTLKEQQKIIDIIEPNENLFLKYSSCVNIDSPENARNDIKLLIDIIEPIEKLESSFINVKNKLLNYENKTYALNANPRVGVLKLIRLETNKYENQKAYIATNAVSEMEIDKSKILDVSNHLPSRADVSPQANSFIVSKLTGENKVYFFGKKPQEVFSTGFFNFSTKYIDHLTGFLLSSDFKKQKSRLATGTTMIGLNHDALAKITIKTPSSETSEISKQLFTISETIEALKKLKNSLIQLLIK